ncbi:DUF2007 domain-containing protein [Carboxylicivirga mesophila]|uniref:DUF2007 domain-containing protein n=1 Tax=Carboxylicivirga mesophila TaxID=1166478 RepID=A0ABS5K4I2_9BACT|nr:DUF2007-related protein [Carboxylicivirga mesophila]MBS2209877.1 DUF2007 domain-containing protein [Carboxylicivirga mesophila]
MDLSSAQQATVEVFSGTLWEAEMIRTLLMDAQIAHFLKNSTLNDFMYDPIGAEGVKVMVLENEVEQAKKIIDNYLQNLNK